MKKIALGVLALLSTGLPTALVAQESDAAQQVDTVNDANLAIAREIVDLGYPPESHETMFFGTMDQMVMQMREGMLQSMEVRDEGAVAILDEWLAEYVAESKTILSGHIPNLMDSIAVSYASLFSSNELADIRSFVGTPSGRKFVSQQVALISSPAFAAANQAYINDITAMLPAAQENLRTELTEYFQAKEAVEDAAPST